jgi:hypothetical protein
VWSPCRGTRQDGCRPQPLRHVVSHASTGCGRSSLRRPSTVLQLTVCVPMRSPPTPAAQRIFCVKPAGVFKLGHYLAAHDRVPHSISHKTLPRPLTGYLYQSVVTPRPRFRIGCRLDTQFRENCPASNNLGNALGRPSYHDHGLRWRWPTTSPLLLWANRARRHWQSGQAINCGVTGRVTYLARSISPRAP